MTEVIIRSDEDSFEVEETSGRVIRINTSNVIYSFGVKYESFTPTNGQTIFTLTELPTTQRIMQSRVFVNGQKIEVVQCYTIVGSQLTIILPYQLLTTDLLEIYY